MNRILTLPRLPRAFAWSDASRKSQRADCPRLQGPLRDPP